MKVISRIFLVILLALVLTPSKSVFALEKTRPANEQVKTKVDSKSCEQITSMSTKLQGSLDAKKQAATDKRVDKQSSLAEKKQQKSNDLAQQRTEWDAKRAENFEKLRSSAKTEAQKAAVEKYIATVTAAISTRRAAHDAALTTFRTELKALLEKQRAQSDTSTANFKAQMDQAVAKAKSSCQSGTSAKEVLQVLKADMQTAQNVYKQSRKTVDVKPQIKVLTQTKKDAMSAARETFLETTKQARKDLKTAFGINETSLEN